MTLRSVLKKYDYLIVAHRGSSGVAPENTISSFIEAINSGAHCIEMDIQVTSDGIPIVFHDKWLSRTTNGTGLIQNLTFREIQKLDSGSWFSNRFSNETIPSLEDVFRLTKNRIVYNIELKNLGSNPEKHIERIVNLIYQYNFNEKIIISSFYYSQLKLIKQIDAKIPTVAIRIPKDITLPSKIARTIGCEGLVCSIDEINNVFAQDANDNGLFLGVYSIDNAKELGFVLQYNIKAIITNFPRTILELLKTKHHAKV